MMNDAWFKTFALGVGTLDGARVRAKSEAATERGARVVLTVEVGERARDSLLQSLLNTPLLNSSRTHKLFCS